MPPKKAGAPSVVPSKSTFFDHGVREAVEVVKQVAPVSGKKKIPVTPVIAPPKETFFKPGFRKPAKPPPPPAAPVTFTRQPYVPRRSFVYDKLTEEPYAEWVGNQALCLETGEVLFESKGRDDDDLFTGAPMVFSFDFSPPKLNHPKDPTIATQDLIDAGVLTLDDFKKGNSALSVEQYAAYVLKLKEVRNSLELKYLIFLF